VSARLWTCRYCGLPAGWFRTQHDACEKRHQNALSKINLLLADALHDTTPADGLFGQLDFIASDGFIGRQDLQTLAKSAFVAALKDASADHLLSKEEDDRFDELWGAFELSPDDQATHTLLKARVLRRIDNGDFEEVDLTSGVLLQRLEQAIWEFRGARWLSVRGHVQYVGSSHGISVRIARGVYYRTGAFRGERVVTDETVEVGIGCLVVTTLALIFDSPGRAIRLPLKKILSVHLYVDAIEVLSDGANKKPAIFMVDDPPFAANLISRLHSFSLT
jgi:hypothetical protein